MVHCEPSFEVFHPLCVRPGPLFTRKTCRNDLFCLPSSAFDLLQEGIVKSSLGYISFLVFILATPWEPSRVHRGLKCSVISPTKKPSRRRRGGGGEITLDKPRGRGWLVMYSCAVTALILHGCSTLPLPPPSLPLQQMPTGQHLACVAWQFVRGARIWRQGPG